MSGSPMDFSHIADADLEELGGCIRSWRPDLGFLTPAFLREREAARLPGEYGSRQWVQRGGQRVAAVLLDFPHSQNQAGWLRLHVLTSPE